MAICNPPGNLQGNFREFRINRLRRHDLEQLAGSACEPRRERSNEFWFSLWVASPSSSAKRSSLTNQIDRDGTDKTQPSAMKNRLPKALESGRQAHVQLFRSCPFAARLPYFRYRIRPLALTRKSHWWVKVDPARKVMRTLCSTADLMKRQLQACRSRRAPGDLTFCVIEFPCSRPSFSLPYPYCP